MIRRNGGTLARRRPATQQKQELMQESLWVDSPSNLNWVHEELRRRGPLIMPTTPPANNQHQDAHLEDDEPSFVASLKSCARTKDLLQGRILHAHIRSTGLLTKNLYLGTTLVSMYAKCGALSVAQEVLLELPARDVVSWSTLIAGFAQYGQGEEALACYDQMQREGHVPDAITYASVLKACSAAQAIDLGKQIHDEIISQGLLGTDVVLGTALVDMYAKCGVLGKAQQVLDELPFRNVVSWSSLIAGYAQRGHGEEALNCYERMQKEGLCPNAITYAFILKACGITHRVDKGGEIHDEIVNQGLLGKHVMLSSALVDMYAKCGVLTKAHQVLNELPVQNVGSWNALIAGYVGHGQGKEALNCFHQMLEKGLSPDAITYICVLKACGLSHEIDLGKEIHDDIVSQGLLGQNVVLGNSLIDMYVKCGVLEKARQVLDDLLVRDAISWNALILGYAQQGQGKEALDCYARMQSEGHSANAITYTSILKACGILQDFDMGKRIHDEIVSQGLLEKDVMLGNSLVDMYAKCGAFTIAELVFEELSDRDVVSWSTLITGYAQQGQGEEALRSYERMKSEGFSPNAVTYVSVLKACGITQELDKGRQIHDEIVSQGLLQNNVVLGTALVDMYAKCGALQKAQAAFDELSFRNVVSWSALIAGYAQQEQAREALYCYNLMQGEGLSPNEITYTSVLKACGLGQEIDIGKQIHDEIFGRGLLDKNVALCNALVDMYAKCGAFAQAQQVLDKFNVQDIVSWSALISGYAQWGRGKEALDCYEQMQKKGLFPNAVTYVCILKACSITKEVDSGKRIHSNIVCQGLLEVEDALGPALVDMYAKCGVLIKAQQVLDELLVQDVVVWNAVIVGYAQQGQSEKALGCHERMRSKGITPDIVSWNALIGAYALQGQARKAMDCFICMQHEGTSPDAITFVCVLSACSHAGLVDEGQMLYKNMSKRYGISPDVEHETCMIDLLSRAGHFDKAVTMIEKMTSSDHLPVWSALLGVCRKEANVDLGRLAFAHAVQLDECDPAAYVCMDNIYAAAGM